MKNLVIKLIICILLSLIAHSLCAQNEPISQRVPNVNNTVNMPVTSNAVIPAKYQQAFINNGHGISADNKPCKCAAKFSDTRQWSIGKRGGIYCVTVSAKSGLEYNRYFSQWVRMNEKRKAKLLNQ